MEVARVFIPELTEESGARCEDTDVFGCALKLVDAQTSAHDRDFFIIMHLRGKKERNKKKSCKECIFPVMDEVPPKPFFLNISLFLFCCCFMVGFSDMFATRQL